MADIRDLEKLGALVEPLHGGDITREHDAVDRRPHIQLCRDFLGARELFHLVVSDTEVVELQLGQPHLVFHVIDVSGLIQSAGRRGHHLARIG